MNQKEPESMREPTRDEEETTERHEMRDVNERREERLQAIGPGSYLQVGFAVTLIGTAVWLATSLSSLNAQVGHISASGSKAMRGSSGKVAASFGIHRRAMRNLLLTILLFPLALCGAEYHVCVDSIAPGSLRNTNAKPLTVNLNIYQ